MNGRPTYLLMDSWGKPLAQGVLLNSIDADVLQIEVLNDQAEAVEKHEIIQILGIDSGDYALKCRLVRVRNDQVILEKLETLDSRAHQNLRIPVHFESFLYPVKKKTAAGRMAIQSVDLSCGGMAFCAEAGLEQDETVELVIPITEQPLIVRGKILRIDSFQDNRILYAAKFIDLCQDEEKMIRRAVFGMQIINGRN